MKRYYWFAITVMLLAFEARAAFSIADVMSAPFASLISSAPTKGRVAWVVNDCGHRNLYVAEGPSWLGRKVTEFDEDDGQVFRELSWSADGEVLFFARGSYSASGATTNAAIAPIPASAAVWSVRMDGSKPVRLTEGRTVAVSPTGASVAFLRGTQLFIMSKDASVITPVVSTIGAIASVRWSPDGSAIAFVDRRAGHSLIAIYHVADNTLVYLDPSVDEDENLVWSPDGKQIAFIRIPGPNRDDEDVSQEAEPFSLRVADVATGRGREVWRADPGPGSAFQPIEATGQLLLWAAGDRLIFPWEKDGWLHLYSVSINGGAVVRMTPNDGEVSDEILSADRRTIFYSSNRDDIDRRHLWRVGVEAGSAPVALTSGSGIELNPVPVADGSALAYIATDARHVAHAMVRRADGSVQELAPQLVPASFPAAQLVEPQPVILQSTGGLQIHGQLFLPPVTASGGKHPALLFLHGGTRRQMLLGFHSMDYYSNTYAFNQYMASRGFVVLSINYRSGTGYGLKFREIADYGRYGASEFGDVLAAAHYLAGRVDVDPKRMGVWGGSFGGYLTAQSLARASDLFAAGVDLHGVHDWSQRMGAAPGHYDVDGVFARATQTAFESSPLAAIKTWRSPVLLIHGDMDVTVSFNQTEVLVAALRKQRVEFGQLVLPNAPHSILLHRNWLMINEAAAEFLERKLAK